jgi:hypothetical protein
MLFLPGTTRVGRLRGGGRRVRGEAQEGNVRALLLGDVSSRAILIRRLLNRPFCRLRLNSVAQRSAVLFCWNAQVNRVPVPNLLEIPE